MTNESLNLQEAEELLPWYLNGTLSDEERALVEQALAAEPALQAELESLSLMRETVREDSDSLALPASDFDLVMQQIDGVQEAPAQVETRAEAPRGFMAQLGELFQMPALRFAGIAAALVITVQSAAIVGLMQSGGPSGATYETATAGETATTETGPRLLVVFQQEASLAEVGALLQELDAQVVEGPSEGGGYVLRLGSAAGDLDSALERLQAQDALVIFAGKAQ